MSDTVMVWVKNQNTKKWTTEPTGIDARVATKWIADGTATTDDPSKPKRTRTRDGEK